MFSHIMVGSNDIARSKKFYDAVFTAMGGKPGEQDAKGRLRYVHNGGEHCVVELLRSGHVVAADHDVAEHSALSPFCGLKGGEQITVCARRKGPGFRPSSAAQTVICSPPFRPQKGESECSAASWSAATTSPDRRSSTTAVFTAIVRVAQPALGVLLSSLTHGGEHCVVELLRSGDVVAADHDVAEHSALSPFCGLKGGEQITVCARRKGPGFRPSSAQRLVSVQRARQRPPGNGTSTTPAACAWVESPGPGAGRESRHQPTGVDDGGIGRHVLT